MCSSLTSQDGHFCFYYFYVVFIIIIIIICLFVFLYATVEIAAFSPPRGCPQLGELQVSYAAGSAGEGHCGLHAVLSTAPCGWIWGITVYIFL